jgi:hypothetical protein
MLVDINMSKFSSQHRFELVHYTGGLAIITENSEVMARIKSKLCKESAPSKPLSRSKREEFSFGGGSGDSKT